METFSSNNEILILKEPLCVSNMNIYLILIRPKFTVRTGMYLRPALALVVVTLQSKGLSRRLEKLLISNYMHPTLRVSHILYEKILCSFFY